MTDFLHAVLAIVAPFLMPVTVEATGYTCEVHPRNPMNAPGMCVVLAGGSEEVMSPGMACPYAWMGMGWYVPSQAYLHCDDTGAYDFLRDQYGRYRPHADIRFATFEAARQWGKRTIVIYRIRLPHQESLYGPRPALPCRLCPARPCHDLRGDSHPPPAGWYGRFPCRTVT
jgi:hypothetical protein